MRVLTCTKGNLCVPGIDYSRSARHLVKALLARSCSSGRRQVRILHVLVAAVLHFQARVLASGLDEAATVPAGRVPLARVVDRVCERLQPRPGDIVDAMRDEVVAGPGEEEEVEEEEAVDSGKFCVNVDGEVK